MSAVVLDESFASWRLCVIPGVKRPVALSFPSKLWQFRHPLSQFAQHA